MEVPSLTRDSSEMQGGDTSVVSNYRSNQSSVTIDDDSFINDGTSDSGQFQSSSDDEDEDDVTESEQ
ncbi:hypothetical protein OROHE_024556 [Orobanche hederae]